VKPADSEQFKSAGFFPVRCQLKTVSCFLIGDQMSLSFLSGALLGLLLLAATLAVKSGSRRLASVVFLLIVLTLLLWCF
jgi:hypothetical protein